MDEDQPPCLKRFGFLPTIKRKKEKVRHRVGRKKSDRHYVRDVRGIYLTSREAESCCLAARGCTIRETAIRMELSPRTVEFYLANARRKLNVSSKGELLQVLYENDFFQQLH